MASAVNYIQPLLDARWDDFVYRHPRSSIFHTTGWLQALRRSYGYEPIAITTSSSTQALQTGMVFCHVNSCLTGRRLVSLPFSDHCNPLVDDDLEMGVLLAGIEAYLQERNLPFLELRPKDVLAGPAERVHTSGQHYLHEIDLRADLDTIFHRLHKSSTQRKIKRAEREHLSYEEGRSKSHLDVFYRLLVLTRRRHQLPPQPREWFRNLIDCLNEAIKIRIAFKKTLPIAAIMTIQHKETLFYKYGCSDTRFRSLGGTHLLLWKSIQEAKSQGLGKFDLGRSELSNTGLITFKERWSGIRSILSYGTIGRKVWESSPVNREWKERMAKRIFSHLPDNLLISAGEILYKHIG